MNDRPGEQNYYEVLEVSTDAPQHEIRAAYLRAKETYSPDSAALYTMFSKEEAQQLRNLIEEAFLVLGDQIKRQKYDANLKGGGSSDQPLPDFSANGNSAPVQEEAPKPNVPNEVPDGFAKTKLSVYEVNDELEQEISETADFDGELLQKIRLYKNIKLEHMSKETRISKSYLAAIENNDYEALPAVVFVRGFVVQISRVLGLDESKVATSYMALLKSSKGNERKH